MVARGEFSFPRWRFKRALQTFCSIPNKKIVVTYIYASSSILLLIIFQYFYFAWYLLSFFLFRRCNCCGTLMMRRYPSNNSVKISHLWNVIKPTWRINRSWEEWFLSINIIYGVVVFLHFTLGCLSSSSFNRCSFAWVVGFNSNYGLLILFWVAKFFLFMFLLIFLF